MLKIIGIVAFIAIWLGIALWGYSNAKRIFSKYKKYRQLPSPIDSRYDALIRNDFDKWNKQRILIGCFTLLPIRVLFFVSMIIGCLIFALLISILGSGIFINNLFTFYLNTYAKLVSRIICKVQERFDNKSISTPIIISNHVNWFDIFYITMGFAPVSFLTKAQVENWPAIGTLAKARRCVFVKRTSQDARIQARNGIRQRIQNMSKINQGHFPLVIFPEGTTSNGKGLLTFKSGAFEGTPPITAFCLKYQCENFDMGLDELNQIDHAILMLTQLPKLIVKKLVFEPNIGQSPQDYLNRCRNQMAKQLGILCTEGGYRDKQTLEQMRTGKKKN